MNAKPTCQVLAYSLALTIVGCGILADVLAPSLPARLGLDPATIRPLEGVTIVAFKNDTRYPATFLAFHAGDALDWTKEARNFSVEVPAGRVSNEVIDCPVGVISPGSLDASYSFDPLAALISSGGVDAEIAYESEPLVAGRSFSCGDVIEIRLWAVRAGEAEEDFAISVRVIPAR